MYIVTCISHPLKSYRTMWTGGYIIDVLKKLIYCTISATSDERVKSVFEFCSRYIHYCQTGKLLLPFKMAVNVQKNITSSFSSAVCRLPLSNLECYKYNCVLSRGHSKIGCCSPKHHVGDGWVTIIITSHGLMWISIIFSCYTAMKQRLCWYTKKLRRTYKYFVTNIALGHHSMYVATGDRYVIIGKAKTWRYFAPPTWVLMTINYNYYRDHSQYMAVSVYD